MLGETQTGEKQQTEENNGLARTVVRGVQMAEEIEPEMNKGQDEGVERKLALDP